MNIMKIVLPKNFLKRFLLLNQVTTKSARKKKQNIVSIHSGKNSTPPKVTKNSKVSAKNVEEKLSRYSYETLKNQVFLYYIPIS